LSLLREKQGDGGTWYDYVDDVFLDHVLRLLVQRIWHYLM